MLLDHLCNLLWRNVYSNPLLIFKWVIFYFILLSCSSLYILDIFFKFYFIYLFWLHWVFISVRGSSPVAASGGHSSSWCAGLSPPRPLLLRSTGSRRAGSAIVAHGPSCSVACGILPDQGSNPCPLHRQADSQPLRHQGSPISWILINLLSDIWLANIFPHSVSYLFTLLIISFVPQKFLSFM